MVVLRPPAPGIKKTASFHCLPLESSVVVPYWRRIESTVPAGAQPPASQVKEPPGCSFHPAEPTDAQSPSNITYTEEPPHSAQENQRIVRFNTPVLKWFISQQKTIEMGVSREAHTKGLAVGVRPEMRQSGLVSRSCLTFCDSVHCSPPAPLSMEFSRQEYWSNSLLQGIFPIQGLNPGLLQCRQILYHLSHQGSPEMREVLIKLVEARVARKWSGPGHTTSVAFRRNCEGESQ